MFKKVFTSIVVLLLITLSFYMLNNFFDQRWPLAENNPEENNTEVQIEILQEGEGDGAKDGDTLTVHYVGMLEDGTKFDSSIDRGDPFTLTLGNGDVIEGWEEGLLGIKVGEKRKLTIPSELAYGESGAAGGMIPPNATLIFEVEALEITE
jgi:peptidylprolyl isomerase